MSFSVIIPSKTASNLAASVKAIRDAGETCEIIVVSDFELEEDRSAYEQVKEFTVNWLSGNSRPFIFSRNINAGIKHATGDVCLLNDDALLQTPEGFSQLQKLAEDHPEFGIIAPVTNVTGQPLQQPHGVGLREVPHIAFVCVYIPRRTIEQVGLLDERYCIDYGVEDLDYCHMVRKAGLKVGVFDHCFVDHGSLISSFRGDPRAPKSYAQNLALFNQKWGIAHA
jgi:GT2 family glycosyltransferase